MKRKALVIDVNEDHLERVSNILADAGYVVFWARNAEEAIEMSERVRPTVILLFIQSERVDGYDIFRRLKKRGTTRDLSVILVIEKFAEDFVARALNLGADDYVFWPGNEEDFVRRVNVVARAAEEKTRELSLQTRYRELFDGEVHGLFLTTKHGKFLDCNETLVRMLGYESRDELLSIDIEKDLYWKPEDREKFKKLMEKDGCVERMRVNFKRKDGEKISILLSAEAIHDERGEIIGYQGANIDVNERIDNTASGKETRSKKYLEGILHRIIPSLPFRSQLMSLMKITELIGERYEKIKRLGLGSFGEVWKVRDLEEGEQAYYVAKIPLSKKFNARFKKEAKILDKLALHPNAVHLKDVVEYRDLVVLVQEFVEGVTLEDKIRHGLERSDIESILRQLIEVVAYAHERKIAHRDIKPENIVIQKNGAIKLLDFGSARDLSQKQFSSTIIGSRPYMAPEQIMGKSSISSDVWAIGVIMYVLYTEYYPFYHEVEKELMDLILNYDPVVPSELAPDIDENIERIILKCLKKDPKERYQNALELKADILACYPDFGKTIPGT